ncbi:winged helix-turn-helix domain-containing protein [Myxococcota bacterium]
MPIPPLHLLIETLLRHFAAHSEGVKTGEAYEAVADAMGLTKEDREQLLPSGSQEVYKNRIGWAQDFGR